MSYYGFQHRPTPCSNTIVATHSMEGCIADCQQGMSDNNDCTTYAVHALVDTGRACDVNTQTSVGVDKDGNCLPPTGTVHDAYTYFAANCAAGGANQNAQCRETAETVLTQHPGRLDRDLTAYQTACPNGRLPCAGAGSEACAAACSRAGVDDGKIVCEGDSAASVQGAFRGVGLRDVNLDPSSSYYDAPLAEMKRYYDKKCAAQQDQQFSAELAYQRRIDARNLGYYPYARQTRTEAPVPVLAQLDTVIQERCRTVDGRRDYQCENGFPRKEERDLLDTIVARDLERQANLRWGAHVAGPFGIQCSADAPLDLDSPCAPDHLRKTRPVEQEAQRAQEEVKGLVEGITATGTDEKVEATIVVDDGTSGEDIATAVQAAVKAGIEKIVIELSSQ